MKKRNSHSQLLGAHFSIKNGMEHALLHASSLNATLAQLFTANARSWRKEIIADEERDRFLRVKSETKVLPINHASYLINLATARKDIREKSFNAFYDECVRTEALQIPFLVLHPGAYTNGNYDDGIQHIANTIDRALEQSGNTHTHILLETVSGGGRSIGGRFEDLQAIIETSRTPQRLGVCFDTCHVFTAGYDIRNEEAYAATMDVCERSFGIARIKLFHMNDTTEELGSRRDRHEHIGKGKIGREAFRLIMNDERFLSVGKCLETPKADDDSSDKRNLAYLKRLYSN